jgi:uncharacterized protein (TIGR02594 family)
MRRVCLALAGLALLIGGGSAEGAGRGGAPAPSLYAPAWRDGAPAIVGRAAWEGGSRIVAEAQQWIGSANPTGTIGPWCADFASFVLQRVGLPPLPNRMASSALRYGPHTDAPRRGDLAVMPHHVGFVAGVEPGGTIDLLSGNYGRRVALAHVSRAAFVAFVAVGEAATPSGSAHHDRKRRLVHLRRVVPRGAHRFERAVPAPTGLSAAAWATPEAANLWRRRSLTEGDAARRW